MNSLNMKLTDISKSKSNNPKHLTSKEHPASMCKGNLKNGMFGKLWEIRNLVESGGGFRGNPFGGAQGCVTFSNGVRTL